MGLEEEEDVNESDHMISQGKRNEEMLTRLSPCNCVRAASSLLVLAVFFLNYSTMEMQVGTQRRTRKKLL